MSATAQTLRPPSRTLMFLEGRAIHEFGAFLGALPLLSLANAFSPDALRAWHARVTRLIGERDLTFVLEPKIDGIGIDSMVPPGFARERFDPRVAIQGNLDPVLLVVGGSPLDAAVAELRREFRGRSYIFNLGHGVLPETDPGILTDLVSLVHSL